MLSGVMERPGAWLHGVDKSYILTRLVCDGLEVGVSDETKMTVVLRAFDAVMVRGEETARKMSRRILCWLWSFWAMLPETFYSQ